MKNHNLNSKQENSYIEQNNDCENEEQKSDLQNQFKSSYIQSKQHEEYISMKQSLLKSHRQESQLEVLHNYTMDKLVSEYQGQNKQTSKLISKQIQNLYENDKIVIGNDLQNQILQSVAQGDKPLQYKLYKRRFLQLVLYGLAGAAIQILYSTTSPIASQLVIIYNSSPEKVNLAMLLYLLGFPIFTFVSSTVIEKWGIYVSMLIGGILSLLCVWLRIFVNQVEYSIVLIIIAQTLAGIGRPFILNCSGKLTMVWCGPLERSVIVSCLGAGGTIASLVGGIIPGVIFGSYKAIEGDNDSIQQGKDLTYKLMLIQAIMTTLIIVPGIIFIRNKPPSPPSFATTVKKEHSLRKGMKMMFTDINFILLFIVCVLFTGYMKAIMIVLSYLLKPFNIDPAGVSVVSISPIITGFIATIIGGIVLKKYYCYKLLLIVCFFGTACALMISYFSFLTEQEQFLAAFALVGVFCIAPSPIMGELGIEVTFPIGESLVGGVLSAGGQGGGVLIGDLAGRIVKGENKSQSFWGLVFISAGMVLCLILILFLKQNLKRTTAEQEQNAIVKETIDQLGFKEVKEDMYSRLSKHQSVLG